jgi:hypothetical protein
MKSLKFLLVFVLLAAGAVGQNSTSTTQTNCTLNGNMADCTSNTQTQAQPQHTSAQSAQQMHQGMQALGTGIAYHKANNWVKKYCKKHPGSTWWYQSPATGRLEGTCPN